MKSGDNPRVSTLVTE